MKKVSVILCIFMLCFNVVFAAEQPNSQTVSNQISNETADETIDKKIENNDTVLPNDVLLLRETILNSFEDEQERTFYSYFIQDEEKISQGMAAKLICQYIGRSPIYLPEKELCSDPYIGRLVIECIWGEFSYDKNRFITLEDWNTLFSKAKQFKINKDYVKETLENDKSNIKQKVSQYREMINKTQTFKKVSLGTLTKGNMQLSLNDETYELYEFLNTSYITLDTLENIGFQKQASSSGLQFIWQGEPFKKSKQANLAKKDIFFNNESLYIGELKTYSLSVGTDTLVPIRALQVYFDLQVLENKVTLNPKYDVMSNYVLSNQHAIVNQTDKDLKIIYSDLYWDGKNIIENKSELSPIMPNGILIKNTELYALKNAAYLTTIINYIETDDAILEINHNLGQDSFLELLKKYNEVIIVKPGTPKDKQTEVEFPASIIIGTMKYSTNGLVKGQKTEVMAAEDGSYYLVKNTDLKTVKVPWKSVSIPKNPPTAKDKPTKEQIEAFINSKNMSSQTIYLVWTDLYRQQTYVFKGEKNEWQLIKTILSSSGRNVTPTPRGIYELQSRVAYFGVDKGYRCKNAFQIYGDYLYHSILFDVTGTRALEGKGVLGNRASHGCIRFSEKDSLWFYNTMKTKTRVWIN